jgi:two-component system response regulator AtoC
MSFTILIVEDEETLSSSLRMALKSEGYNILCSGSGEEALKAIEKELVDLVILDIRLPGMNGLQAMEKIKELDPMILTIVMTGYAEVETAVRAMKMGAYDYINKPFELDEMKMIISKALETQKLKMELNRLRRGRMEGWAETGIIASSEKMKEVLELVEKVSQTPKTSVLIQGETGTGKELIAHAIHNRSFRANKPLMDINCSAIPENLMEAHIFGHEKGAFTDAKTQHKGLFELGDGGTVFLDEIGDLSLSLQPKLLRFLETQTFKRVGGTLDLKVDVRIIAATNKDLAQATKERFFREDLYYRLKVMEIHIPPLRQRRDDVIPLAYSFLSHFNWEFKKAIKGISPKAKSLLEAYNWPGNIRELKNSIERAVLLTGGEEILPQHLPWEIRGEEAEETPAQYRLDYSLEEMERMHILNVLRDTGGNKSVAARRLGISRSTLREKLIKYGQYGRGSEDS